MQSRVIGLIGGEHEFSFKKYCFVLTSNILSLNHSVFLPPETRRDLPVVEITLVADSIDNKFSPDHHAEPIKRIFSQYGTVAALNFDFDMDKVFIIYEDAESVSRALAGNRGKKSSDLKGASSSMILNGSVFCVMVGVP